MMSPDAATAVLRPQGAAWYLDGPGGGSRCLDESGAVIHAPSLRLDYPGSSGAELYRHGWTSWSPTAWWSLDRDPWRVWDNPERLRTAEDPGTDCPERHRSYLLTAVRLPGGGDPPQYLLVGRLGGATGVLDVLPGRIEASPLDGAIATDPGDPTQDRASWWVGVGTEMRVFEQWARALRTSLHEAGRAGAAHEDPGPVWSSWYSWFEEVTAQAIRDEIPPAARRGYAVIQIDDGWQRGIGEWEPNSDFPEGMEALASEIRDAGMVPGLWIAPFIVSAGSPIALDHPDYLVHSQDGAPVVAGYNWGAPYYALDCTHPGASRWLADVIERVVSWGYGYLKADFLNAAAIPGGRYRRTGREEAYRLGLQAIRRAAPDAYLMASGAVVAPSLGLVDGMRVGPDTAPYWDNTERRRDPSGPGVRNALRNAVARYWLSGLVSIDPDVATARSRGSLLSPEACAVTQQMALITGVAGCSDPDAWLTDRERDEIQELCMRARRGARIERLGRYRFSIDGDPIDLEPWINPSGRVSDRILAK